MISIRLSRFGHKNAPFYRIVAVTSRSKQGGRVLANLGTWNPFKKEVKIEKDKVKNWADKGAQISPAVKKLMAA